jgi:hypothetical protein
MIEPMLELTINKALQQWRVSEACREAQYFD